MSTEIVVITLVGLIINMMKVFPHSHYKRHVEVQKNTIELFIEVAEIRLPGV